MPYTCLITLYSKNTKEKRTRIMANESNKRQKSWKTILLWFFIICFTLVIYSLAWIPAIIAIIIFAIKKGPNKKRNLLISIAICISSFFVFMNTDSSTVQLTSLQVEWSESEYDIKETTELTLSPIPEDAKIKTLSISDNSIATLEYKNGKAIVSFKADGSEDIYFIANDKIKSNKNSIKVIDTESELKAKEEKLAAEKAEKERVAQEQAEAERIAAEQAEAERVAEQAEAERIAQEQAEAAKQDQNETNNFNTYDNPEQQQTTSSYVLNTSTMKFHSPNCRDVSKIAPQNYSTFDGTRDDIIGRGYSPCGHCKP